MRAKRFFMMVLALLMMATVSLCVAAEKPKYAVGERTEKLLFQTLNPAWHPAFVIYKTDFNEMADKKEPTTVRLAFQNGMSDMDCNGKSAHKEMQYKNKTTYFIDHDAKTYWQMIAPPEKPISIIGEHRETKGKKENQKPYYQAGKEKIKGVMYDYEDRIDGKHRVRYYYEVDTENWKYERDGKKLKEIVDYGSYARNEWFRVPYGYKQVPNPMEAAQAAQEDVNVEIIRGTDTFCQMNLLTLLAYLEELGYTGKVSLTLIDDETFSTIEEGIPVPLGIYRAIFHTLLVVRRTTPILGVIRGDAIRHFWDYHNDDGFLAHTVREHSDEDEEDLLFRLINISAEYGLSEEMANRLIKKYKE